MSIGLVDHPIRNDNKIHRLIEGDLWNIYNSNFQEINA